MGTKLTKKELAQIRASHDLGKTGTQIAKKLGRSHHTVLAALRDPEIWDDPDLRDMIETVKKRELDDLTVIGYKARRRLHQLLDNGEMRPIEACAVMDRSFQQRQILESPRSTGGNAFIQIIMAAGDRLHARMMSQQAEDEAK